MDDIQRYYDLQFIESKESGSIYEPLTILLSAAHRHRMQVLDKLPIGSMEGKTVVDFGTGSWGFGCVYPRLHNCGFAIGIDISQEAVKISEAISEKGDFAYQKRFKYFVSDGISVPLPDASVDLFFTGECIEHVENTDAFLDEIYRVLKPEGQLVLTTPNPSPVLYRSFGDSYAVGPEHIALMTLEELSAYMLPRFELKVIKGYNTSVHSSVDQSVKDASFAEHWAALHEDVPEDACGFIVLAQKKPGWKPRRYSRTVLTASSNALSFEGKWEKAHLHHNLEGLLGRVNSQLRVRFTGSEAIVLFWIHNWSGVVEISVGKQTKTLDLFSSAGGMKRVIFSNLNPDAEHEMVIRPTGEKCDKSPDSQVIFFSASSYAPV